MIARVPLLSCSSLARCPSGALPPHTQCLHELRNGVCVCVCACARACVSRCASIRVVLAASPQYPHTLAACPSSTPPPTPLLLYRTAVPPRAYSPGFWAVGAGALPTSIARSDTLDMQCTLCAAVRRYVLFSACRHSCGVCLSADYFPFHFVRLHANCVGASPAARMPTSVLFACCMMGFSWVVGHSTPLALVPGSIRQCRHIPLFACCA